jgi:hypothetical protein
VEFTSGKSRDRSFQWNVPNHCADNQSNFVLPFNQLIVCEINMNSEIIKAKFISAIAIPNFFLFSAFSQEAIITVKPGEILHPVSPYLTGACLEDVNHEVYGGLYSQMIFGESFQEPAAPEARAGFTEYGGPWSLTNNVLFSGNGDGPKLIAGNINQSSGDLKVQIKLASDQGGDAGVVFQVSQPATGADNFTGYEVSLGPDSYVVLGRHRQNWESINRVFCAVPQDKWIDLEVEYTNASINVLVNGNSLIQYTDTQYPLTSGQVGLRNYRQDAYFQNFQINRENIAFSYEGSWPGAISGMWRPVATGSASGACSLVTGNVFVGNQSQQITFTAGTGKFGVANQSLNRWGMNFIAGNEYDGCLDVRADAPVPITLSLESTNGLMVYAQTNLMVTKSDWERLNFSLVPSGCDKKGQFVISLTQPGSVVLGYAFLQPGGWGQFKGLPVRNDVAEGLIHQGVKVLRYGGSMANSEEYRWKKMIGPRDLRLPYRGTWYPYSSNGWGIPDFLNFCEAAGFLGVPDFNINENPQDMADFIEYANGSTNTVWGAKRVADGHPQPYNLKYLELGNEERVDDDYFQKFQALALAIWAKDTNVIPVVGDFSYHEVIKDPFHFTGADSRITTLSAQQKILHLAKEHHQEVWFDVHVWDDGPSIDPSLPAMFSYDDALAQIADGAKYRVLVFELNANHHDQGRALGNALAINAALRDGRLPIVTSANCLQPDGQNDNGWDQGLLFLNPYEVWLQPPGYVTQIYSDNYQPEEVRTDVSGASSRLDVSAESDAHGDRLVVYVVNPTEQPITSSIIIDSELSQRSERATVEELRSHPNDVNLAEKPHRIQIHKNKGSLKLMNGRGHYTFSSYSITLLKVGAIKLIDQ